MTALTRERHRRHANPFTVRGPIAVPDWQGIFGRNGPFAIDIGCGPGRFVVQLAAAHPEWNVVGLEIRQHLVAETLAHAAAAGTKNAHALLANASTHMWDLFAERSIAFVSINFPDPWYKKRHHKRRVVQPPWLERLAGKLRDDAEVHAMSDYQPIACEMFDALRMHAGFACTHGERFAPQSTTGLSTERELIHTRRGEQIYRMHFRYRLANCGDIR